jgi:hypothetical protein
VGEGRERVHQDGALLHLRSRLSKDLAEPERDEQVARRGGFLEHLADDADQYRRYAVPLDLPRDQSAGPMARRSPRGQDDVIDAVLPQKARDRGSGLRDEAPLLAIHNVTHRADVTRRHAADAARCGELAQPFEGEHDVDVRSAAA